MRAPKPCLRATISPMTTPRVPNTRTAAAAIPKKRAGRLPRLRTFADLFAGIGGFRVALEARGLRCVFSCEIDEHARRVYQANFQEVPEGDVTRIEAREIPTHDVLCAGFPCQAFSLSGNRKGMSEPRGQLFFEIVRIAKHHRPQVLLLENVPNIRGIDGGKVMRTIRDSLKRIGYVMHADLLDASQFGIPQKRVRVYFVCLREDASLSYATPPPPTIGGIRPEVPARLPTRH